MSDFVTSGNPALTTPLADRIDYFLMERAVLDEHQRKLNERLQRGEWVQITPVPVAPVEEGFALLREAAEALRGI